MVDQRKIPFDLKPRPDEDILEEVWSRLWGVETIRVLDLDHINFEVQDGKVILTGHLSKCTHRELIQGLVEGIPGVRSVQNELIVDRDLAVEVAQVLADDPHTRPFLIQVGACHGWIHLNGEVPTEECCAAVEEIAARVPRARGIVTLPRISGQKTESFQRQLQPLIDARVYARDGQLGKVSEVVFNPRNRLVSHIIVDARFEVGGGYKTGVYVFPAESIQHENGYSVFHKITIREVAELSTYEPEDFPPAPQSWRPPFPYTSRGLRWSCELGSVPWLSAIEATAPSHLVHHG